MTAAPSFPAVVRRIVLIGHSMARCTVAGPEDGNAIPAGWTVLSEGASVATWPASATGILYGLVTEAIAGGAVDGDRWIVRRSTPGSKIGSAQDTHLADARDDVAGLSGEADVVLIWLGANDAQDAAELAAYSDEGGLERLVRLAREEFPLAPILLVGEETGDPVETYPELDEINLHKQAVAAEIGSVLYVPIVGVELVDDIHPDTTPGGYDFVAAEVAAVWTT